MTAPKHLNAMRSIRFLVTILAMTTPAWAFAQSLPGPANAGWYVLMGRIDGAEALGCAALVRPAADSQGAVVEPGPDNYFRLLITKRYGPYPTDRAAITELTKAGWKSYGDITFGASSGC